MPMGISTDFNATWDNGIYSYINTTLNRATGLYGYGTLVVLGSKASPRFQLCIPDQDSDGKYKFAIRPKWDSTVRSWHIFTES